MARGNQRDKARVSPSGTQKTLNIMILIRRQEKTQKEAASQKKKNTVSRFRSSRPPDRRPPFFCVSLFLGNRD